MTAKRECSKNVTTDNGWHWGPCSRPATVERDGDWWCWQHDPERVKADKKDRRSAAEVRADRRAAVWQLRARNARLAALVTEETAALLEWLAIDIEILQEHFVDTFDNDDRRDAKVGTARALAARIREALALEEETNV